MPSDVAKKMSATLFRKSLMLAAATSAPMVSSLIAVLVFQRKFGESGVLTLGMAGNIVGILVALSAGCMVLAVRTFAKLRATKKEVHEFRDAFHRENQSAYLVSAVSLLLVLVLSLTVPLGASIPTASLHVYMLAVTPWLLIFPLTQVAYGVLQAFGKERAVLHASLTVLVLQLLGVLLVVQSFDELNHALIAAGLIQSTVALGVFLYRLILVRNLLGGSLQGTFAPQGTLSRFSSVPDRVMAGSDGLIYMGTFAAATYLASVESVEDGALVALVISYMRLVVIPLKQFGLVGGRMVLQKKGTGGLSSSDVRRAVRLPCLGAGVIVAVLSLVLLPEDVGYVIAALTFVQLAMEPYSGVSYALGKVVYGPRKLHTHLVVLYLVVLPVLWLCVFLLDVNSGLTIWSTLFLVRCLMTLTLSVHVNRIEAPAARA